MFAGSHAPVSTLTAVCMDEMSCTAVEAAWMLSCAWLIPESRVGSDEPVGNPSEYSVHGFLSSEAR